MSLDPEDWDDFRKQTHDLLDACIDRLQDARSHPWQAPSAKQKKILMPALPKTGQSIDTIAQSLVEDVLPTATGNTHPKFFGWVHGTGLASGLMSEIVAATMNSNCGGREHGAIYVERCVIEWAKEIFEFPSTASGLLTVGTSQATVIALACARAKLFGLDIRQKGISEQEPVRVYCREGTHSCVAKALELLGHGSDCVITIPCSRPSDPMDMALLEQHIKEDRAAGFKPLAIVGTAGAVNTGAFDDLSALADFCEREDIWLHIDGAFGAWAKIADAPWCDLTSGIEKADSIAFDFTLLTNFGCKQNDRYVA